MMLVRGPMPKRKKKTAANSPSKKGKNREKTRDENGGEEEVITRGGTKRGCASEPQKTELRPAAKKAYD